MRAFRSVKNAKSACWEIAVSEFSTKIMKLANSIVKVPFFYKNNIFFNKTPCFSVQNSILNRWSLGDFTKMEGAQMEMFNFLWLIWDHYLPLTPTKNDWPPWHPQGGVQIYPKGKFTR